MNSRKYYDRWKFTVSLEEWLRTADRRKIIKVEELYQMLAEITGECIIKSIKKENNYYVAQGDKKSYEFALEKIQQVVSIVVFYEDHCESYDYTQKLRSFCETYYYNNNGKIEEFFFGHHLSNSKKYRISCRVLDCKLEISFFTSKNVPLCKLIPHYKELFNEVYKFSSADFSHYDEKYKEKSTIQNLLDLLKNILKIIKDNKLEFRLRSDAIEYVDYLDGKLSGMRVLIDSNYVIISKNQIWWEENVMHHEEFTSKNGIVYDGNGRKVKDLVLAQKIISCIEKAEKIFKEF